MHGICVKTAPLTEAEARALDAIRAADNNNDLYL